VNEIILDTDITSFIFNGHTLAQRYESLIGGRERFICFATLGEIHEGLYRSNWSRAKIDLCLKSAKLYPVVYPDALICETWGWVRSIRKNRQIALNDAWIAASAISYSVPLATHNASDFADIPGLQLLTI